MEKTLWALVQELPDEVRVANYRNYESKGFPLQVREYCAGMIETFWLERNVGIPAEHVAEMSDFFQDLIFLVKKKIQELGETEAGLLFIGSLNLLQNCGAQKVCMTLKECLNEDLRVVTEFTGSYAVQPHRITWMLQTLKYKELLVRSDAKTLESLLKTHLKNTYLEQKSLLNQMAEMTGGRSGSIEHLRVQKNLETVKGNLIFLTMQLRRVVQGIVKHCQTLYIGLKESYDDIYGSHIKKLKLSSCEELIESIPNVSTWMKEILKTIDWAIHTFSLIGRLAASIPSWDSQPEFKQVKEVIPGLKQLVEILRMELLQNVMVVRQQGPNVYKRGNIFQKNHDSKGVKVQLLAGEALFSGVEVEAVVINEEQGMGLIVGGQPEAGNSANRLDFVINPYNDIIGNGSAKGFVSNMARFQPEHNNPKEFAAIFGNLMVPLKGDIKRSYPPRRRALQERFCILFRSCCFVNGLEVLNWCCTAPFTYASHASQRIEGEAAIFWDEAFRQEIRCPLQVIEMVSIEALLLALNRFFNKLTRTNRKFSKENIDFLRNKISRELNLVNENQAVNMTDFCTSHAKPKPEEARPASLTFWDWFFGATELIKNHLQEYWNSGHVIGFINKVEAGNILKLYSPGTLMIRFPEIEAGSLHYSIHEPDGTIAHWQPVPEKVLELFPFAENVISTMKNGHAKEICHYNEKGEFLATKILDVFGDHVERCRTLPGNEIVPYIHGDPGRIPFESRGAAVASVETVSIAENSSDGIWATDQRNLLPGFENATVQLPMNSSRTNAEYNVDYNMDYMDLDDLCKLGNYLLHE